MIEYKKMSLFDAPKGSLIIHACNAQGVWGSGIAKEFKSRYPDAFREYRFFCMGVSAVGMASFMVNNDPHRVGWLITSEGFGETKSPKSHILTYTTLAIQQLITFMMEYGEDPIIYSNKFNSGLFDVPWEETETIINIMLKRYPQFKWIVCDPNLDEK